MQKTPFSLHLDGIVLFQNFNVVIIIQRFCYKSFILQCIHCAREAFIGLLLLSKDKQLPSTLSIFHFWLLFVNLHIQISFKPFMNCWISSSPNSPFLTLFMAVFLLIRTCFLFHINLKHFFCCWRLSVKLSCVFGSNICN